MNETKRQRPVLHPERRRSIRRSDHVHSITAPGRTRRRYPAGNRHPPDSDTSASGPVGRRLRIVSLCLTAASFVTAPFLLLIPVAGFIPAVLAAAGAVSAWLGLKQSDRRPGLAVAGLLISVMLFGLMLSIAMLWTRLVVAPAVSDHSELQEVIDHIKRLIFGS